MIATVTLNPSLDEWMQLDTLRVGGLNRATGFARYPGGKGINVSRVIHELGGSTIAYGVAGGEDGLILRELMNRLAIPHEFLTVQGTTRNNYKIRTVRPRALTEINAAGPAVSAGHLSALARRLMRRRPPFRCVAFCGSLPPGAPETIYRSWIRALRLRGILAVLDASGAALKYGIAGRPWCIKPNRQEAEELLGRRLTRPKALIAAAQELLLCGPAISILSLGREGAVLASSSPSGVWMARPPVMRVDSAVGAGDSLVGGFLVGWAKGLTLLESFRLGVACGTASAMSRGTELCHRIDVQRIRPRVTIRQVA